MKTLPFDPSEMKVSGTFPNFYTGEPVARYTTPVSSKENVIAAMQGHPYWQPTPADFGFFSSHYSRHFCPRPAGGQQRIGE